MKIAISGPAASGKGTVAKLFARKHRISYVDAGLIFRSIAFCEMEGCKTECTYIWNGEEPLVFRKNQKSIPRMLLAEDLIAEKTSLLAADPIKFEEMVSFVSKIIDQFKDVIVDGRSAGTVLLPEADAKFYLIARCSIRAKRRFDELMGNGLEVTFTEVLKDIQRRDKRDRSRTKAPLRIPLGACVIKTDRLSPSEVVEHMEDFLKKKDLI